MMHILCIFIKCTDVYLVILQCLESTKALFKLHFVQRALTTHLNLPTETIHMLFVFSPFPWLRSDITLSRVGEVVNCLTCVFGGAMQGSLGCCYATDIPGFLRVPLPPFCTEM